MKPIQTPDMSRALQNFFRLVGRIRLNVDEVVVPVVNLADLGLSQVPPIVRAATGHVGSAAVVGQRFWMAIRVPRGVGMKITRLHAYTRNATPITLDFYWAEGDPGVLGNVGYSNFTDGRLTGKLIDTNAVELQWDTIAGVPTTQRTGSWLLDQNQEANEGPEHWVLGSSSQDSWLNVVAGSTNAEVRMDFEWIEFDLPGE